MSALEARGVALSWQCSAVLNLSCVCRILSSIGSKMIHGVIIFMNRSGLRQACCFHFINGISLVVYVFTQGEPFES